MNEGFNFGHTEPEKIKVDETGQTEMVFDDSPEIFHGKVEEDKKDELEKDVDSNESTIEAIDQELLEELERLREGEKDPVAQYALMEKISELRMKMYYSKEPELQNISNSEVEDGGENFIQKPEEGIVDNDDDPWYDQHGKYGDIKRQQREALIKATQQGKKTKFKPGADRSIGGYDPFL